MIHRRWRRAEVQDRSGEKLAEVRATVWRTTGQTTPGGQRYDYIGTTTAEAREALVGKQNRVLAFIEGESYQVQDAMFWPTMNYVEVRLIQVKGDG